MAEIKRVRMKEWRDGQPSCALSCAGVEGLECRRELKVNALVWTTGDLFFCSEEHAGLYTTLKSREYSDQRMEETIMEVITQTSRSGVPFSKTDPIEEMTELMQERRLRDLFDELTFYSIKQMVREWFFHIELPNPAPLAARVSKLEAHLQQRLDQMVREMEQEGGVSGGPSKMMELNVEARARREASKIARVFLGDIKNWREVQAKADVALASLPKAVK